jgi:DNA-binding beta-propeller fold protein YncE
VWALSAGEQSLTIIDGFQNTVVKKIYGFVQPRWISIDPSGGEVWISEQGNNRLVMLNALLPPASQPDTIGYQNVVIYPENGAAGYLNSPFKPFVGNTGARILYVADRDDREVERFIRSGSAYVRSDTPISLNTTQPRAVFVVNADGAVNLVVAVAVNGKLLAFNESNPATLTSLNGDYTFQVPRALAVDQLSGECWIGDNGTNQLVKIQVHSDFSFTTLHKLDGFVFLEDMVINK